MSGSGTMPRRSLGDLVRIAVVCSIAILALVFLFAPPFCPHSPGPTHDTRALLERLAEMLTAGGPVTDQLASATHYQAECRRQEGAGEAANVGSELLHRALVRHQWKNGLPYFREWNTDEDEWPAGTEPLEAMEVADAWGHPIIVVFREWLQVLAGNDLAYVDFWSDPVDAPVPPLGKSRFALISMGADGVPGSDDDIVVLGGGA